MTSSIDDPLRLDAVRRSSLIDTAPEVVFDELTKAAAQLLKAPFAFMTVVDDERSYWKSAVGIVDGTRANSVEESFCQYVVESGEDLIVDDTTANNLTRNNPSIDSMGVMSWAGCPVRVDGHVLGTFCVVDQETRSWTEGDRELLQNLTRVAEREIQSRLDRDRAIDSAAEALVTIGEYQDLLDILRTSFLPPTLPEIAGVSLGAWYQPAVGGDLLLGDFYDAFSLGDDCWGVVVGDVCGHGAEAARLTSLVRYTLRAAAVQHEDPATVLVEVDAALHRDGVDSGRFATLVYAKILDSGENIDVVYGRAGHPLPVLLTPGLAPRLVDGASGPPVGLLPGSTVGRWNSAALRLERGQSLLLYTDGAIECRSGQDAPTALGEEGFLRLLDDMPDVSGPELVSEVVRRMTHIGAEFTDDTVLFSVTSER